jgi:hypothetical protein
MKRILPIQPIHGFRFAQLLSNALIWSGYIKFSEKKRNWTVDDRFFYLTNEELEDIIQDYLTYMDNK